MAGTSTLLAPVCATSEMSESFPPFTRVVSVQAALGGLLSGMWPTMEDKWISEHRGVKDALFH